ncbi:MAG: diguanylate cyclase, partial [Pseudomonadales bacterium]|nr:diguanylate cyclase [Pseudomonadales bacterium]
RKSEPGFLQKLFGGMGESGREPGSPAQIHDTQQPGMDSASTLAVDKDSDLTTSTNSNGGDRRYSEQETELDVSEPELSEADAQHHQGESESTEEAPGFSKVAGHISKSIRQLLEHLSVPSSSQQEFQAILQRIEHGLNWYELGPTLDDVTNLVVSAVGKGQKDFESFLQLLDERLAMLQQFLTDSHAFKVAIQSSGAELDEAVREQVKSISALVSEATEIDTLKSSVNSQLDHILTLMTKFMTSESIKEKSLGEQISSMSEKLQSMETETQAIKEQLKVERGKALTDALTGLPNREAYVERIDLEYTRWQRYRQPMSLVITDIDLFKQVNDNYGHLAGDKVIQIMAKELQRRIRKTDFIARYGGEEFVIIMPETASDVAFTVMNKTRQMVERLPFHFRNQRVQITMSFGIAPFKDGLSMDEIFELADGALYKAKEQGRNCVVVEGMDGRGPIHP